MKIAKLHQPPAQTHSNISSVVVIVDGYRIGSFYAPHLYKQSYACIHVQSTIEIHKSLKSSFHPEDYLQNIIYRGDLGELVQALKNYQILCVIPGLESGVELADQLSEKLGLPTSNGTHMSEARRNKYKMIDALKKHHLKSADQFLSDNLEAMLDWTKRHNQWPVVVKPNKAAATELVTFCYNLDDVRKAFHRVMTEETTFGKNDHVLIQSFIQGKEYIVNTVSVAGKHFLSDLYIYNKKVIPGYGPVYDYLKSLPYSFEQREVLVQYIFQVLDALEIKYGGGHAEVFLAPDGPTLVEIGARVMGAFSPDLIEEVIGRSHLDLIIDSYLHPEKLIKTASQPYQSKKYFFCKLLIAPVSGKLRNIRYLSEIKNLPSFREIKLGVNIGSHLDRTLDLTTCPGLIYLVHEKEEVVMRDYEKLVEFEKDMFEVE
jgi:biotin carboxylase